MSGDWRKINKANWDERTAIYLGPGGYDLSAHRAGKGRLDAIVDAELGPVAGLRVLHLQSHLGDDSIAIAQRGAAEVVGIDFSAPAVAAATKLAAEAGAGNARFVESDLYAAPDALPGEDGRFDLVFTSWGTITWLPDLDGWAKVIAHFLKPGGAFYFADSHPAALVFDGAKPEWHVPYFERDAREFDSPNDYANPEAVLSNTRTIEWLHPLADTLGALRGAGLQLDWLHEHPRIVWKMFPFLVPDADRMWTWPDKQWLPLALSLRAARAKS